MRSNGLARPRLAALVALLTLSLPSIPLRAEPPARDGAAFPSPRMVELFAARLADELLADLSPTDAQLQAARAAAQARAGRWFEQRRSEVVGAAGRYIELTLESEKPTAAMIADWSREALPLLDEAQNVFGEFAREVRLSLNADQAARWDADQAAMRVAFSFARSKLTIWRDGGFDPDIDWPGGDGFAQLAESEQQLLVEAQRKARQALPLPTSGPAAATTATAEQRRGDPPSADSPEIAGDAIRPRETGEIPLIEVAPPPQLLPVPKAAEQRSLNDAGPAVAASRPAESQPAKDDWHDLVRAFCRRFDLNAEQDRRAMVFLREAQRRRDRYQESRLADFRRVEQELRSPGEKNLAALQREYEKLRGPIDDARRQLLERLNTIPTEAQRRAVETGDERAGGGATSQPGAAAPKG